MLDIHIDSDITIDVPAILSPGLVLAPGGRHAPIGKSRPTYTRHFFKRNDRMGHVQGMESSSIDIDGLTYRYESDGSRVSCGEFFTDPALPRHLLCFSGQIFELSSLRCPDHLYYFNANLTLFSICVPSSIVSIGRDSFAYFKSLSFVAFESGSRLSTIEPGAFTESSSLKSICIPSGIETLTEASFKCCYGLAAVTFERHSRLSNIRRLAFFLCFPLESICLPAGLESIEAEALTWSYLGYVGIETGNRHVSISGNWVLGSTGTSIVGHVGVATEVVIGNDIEELCDACFSCQSTLSLVSFEPDSRLRRIGERVFSESLLRSITIPSAVEIIGEQCFWCCLELSIVRFEPNSRLSVVAKDAFVDCYALEAIWIPCHIQSVVLSQFASPASIEGRPGWYKFHVIIIETGLVIDSYLADSRQW
jgi:hypothetical protein